MFTEDPMGSNKTIARLQQSNDLNQTPRIGDIRADVKPRRDVVRASILGRWAPWIGGLLMLALLASAGCAPAEAPAINPPSGVVRFTEERGFNPDVANAEVDLLLALRPRYGRMQAQRWQAPRSLS